MSVKSMNSDLVNESRLLQEAPNIHKIKWPQTHPTLLWHMLLRVAVSDVTG